MALIVNTNIASLTAQRHLAGNTDALSRSFERLSSGFRINRAGDDAAGLQISETLRSQIRGVNQDIRNAQEGLNLLAVTEGTLSVVQENLQRIRELTVQAANDTNGSPQRAAIKLEVDARLDDINRIVKSSQFNGIDLLIGTPNSVRLQVGPNGVASIDTIEIGAALGSATATTLGVVTSTNALVSNSNARAFLATLDTALTAVSTRRATIGSYQSRLQSAINNLQITSENLEASDSLIRNTDIAKETAELSRNQILQQAAATILSQANATPQLALQLLR